MPGIDFLSLSLTSTRKTRSQLARYFGIARLAFQLNQKGAIVVEAALCGRVDR